MILMELPSWELLLAIGTAIAMLVSFWHQVRHLLDWIASWLVVVRVVDHGTGQLMVAFLHDTMKLGAPRVPAYASAYGFVKPLGRIYRVMYQVLYGGTEGLTFWSGKKPLWFRSSKGDTTERYGARSDFLFRFSFVRGTFDWEALLFAATVWEDEMKHGDLGHRRRRFHVRTHYGTSALEMQGGGMNELSKVMASSSPDPMNVSEWNQPTVGHRFVRWTSEDIQNDTIVSTLDQLSLRPELTELATVIRFWHGSQQWYLDHGIPWRLGVLGHGVPGTGKTSFIRAIAEVLDLPVHMFDLASMSNQDLQRAWRQMLTDAPCVALLEDLDGVFVGRTNITPTSAFGGGGLTFDTLLKCIDGIERTDGMLLYVTTNRFETIDDALAGKPTATEGADPEGLDDTMPTRPGRIDRVVEFHPLDLEGRVKMARRILEDEDQAQAVAEAYATESAAQFQERCFRLALDRRFADQKGSV